MRCVLLSFALLCTLTGGAVTSGQTVPPEPSAESLSHWRGFNLIENLHDEWANEPFKEQDFQLIQELGFNFVRLPLDYRIWARGTNKEQFSERKLRRIDQAIQWGQKYSIHVCINFHRAPGYTVSDPPEPTDLWTNASTQELCALHWRTFAQRYRNIPNRYVSFNLFNEPPASAGDNFVPVVKKIVAAIRDVDPDRLIISDGLEWGSRPVLELASLKIAQATRGYSPHNLTHYRAPWLDDSDTMITPRWPQARGNGLLCSATKSDVPMTSRRPMKITGQFNEPTILRLRVDSVSSDSDLVVKVDGRTRLIKRFRPGPGEGEWKSSAFHKEWNLYTNHYDRDYFVAIPRRSRQIDVQVAQGDWISLSEIGIRPADQPDAEKALSLNSQWGEPTATVHFQSADTQAPFLTNQMEDKRWLWDTTIQPWVIAKQNGIGVLVGEFGVYRKTPHDVTLAWMEDALASWKEAGFGWALWNFRGEFGVLDSKRSDVDYERFRGHQLDRKMLNLLQKY